MIGFVGLGNMGGHMARNLLKSGKKLVVYDVNIKSVEALQNEGATVAKSPADLARAASLIITMLPSNPHVESVYAGTNGILDGITAGSLCLDSSTIEPNVSKRMAKLLKEKKSEYLDTPVSGGVAAAKDGLLTFMVGGDSAAFAKAEPILKLMGKNIVYCGDSGNGQAAKICNNMLLGISMIGVSETMNLGKKLGLDPKLLASIINTSSGRCWSSELYNPVPGVLPNSAASRDYTGGFGTALMTKDLSLAQSAATQAQAPTPLGSLAHQLYRIMCQTGYADKDFSAAYQFISTKQN